MVEALLPWGQPQVLTQRGQATAGALTLALSSTKHLRGWHSQLNFWEDGLCLDCRLHLWWLPLFAVLPP